MIELVKNESAIADMRVGGEILAKILKEISKNILPGIKTIDIENNINRLCLKYGVKPAFKGYKPAGSKSYDFSSCISVNEEVVHGRPSSKEVSAGDIVTVDMGVICNGYITDSAVTVPVGEIAENDKKLLKITEDAMYAGIDKVKEGARVGDISSAIQEYTEKNGFNVFKSLAGHGVGEELHEEPTIPNFGSKNMGMVLKAGMTLAIETMITSGSGELNLKDDGWTLVSADGKNAAQFEHTVLVTKDGYDILTIFGH